MPRRRQQRKKISKFEFARKKEHQVRFDWAFYRDREEQHFCRSFTPRALDPAEMKEGRNGVLPAVLSPSFTDAALPRF